jgi:hypothetical protein
MEKNFLIYAFSPSAALSCDYKESLQVYFYVRRELFLVELKY